MVQRTYVVGDPRGTYWERRWQDGDDTPQSLRKTGRWPVNRYSTEKEAQTQNFVRLFDSQGYPFGSSYYSVASFGMVTLSPVSLPQEADVINKLGEKWRDTELDLAMYLSPEGRESVGMMTTGLLKIANSARALKRGDFGGFLRNLNKLPRHARKRSAEKFNQGDLSGAFLSAHLGWEPLIKDAFMASAGIEDIPDRPHRITATKRGTVKGTTSSQTLKWRLTSDVFVKLALDIERPPTFAQRFGLDNPFRIAWELVPLSFVADYFLPIGSVISAMGTVSALYGMNGFRKELVKFAVDEEFPVGACKVTGSWNVVYSNRETMYRKHRKTSFKRTKWTPSFQDPLKNLRVHVPTSVMKLSTVSALAHQRILALAKR